MKKNIFKQIILVLVLVCSAVAVHAYTPPISAPSENNTVEPIDIGADNQIKNGGLSVNAFLARGNALFGDRIIAQGLVNGANPSIATSTVRFGGTDSQGKHTVLVQMNGTLRTEDVIVGKDLAHGTNDLKPLCADDKGKVIFCPEKLAVVDGACGDTQIYDGQNYELCSQGEARNVNQNQCTWTWTCEGANGGNNASCSADVYYWLETVNNDQTLDYGTGAQPASWQTLSSC